MIAEALKTYLDPLSRRVRLLKQNRAGGITWIIGSLVAVALLVLTRNTDTKPFLLLVILLGGTWLTLGLIKRRAAHPAENYEALARRLSHELPDLESLLVTAVEQTPEPGKGEFNYLQDRVIQEAVDHAVKHNWIQTVSDRQLVRAQTGRRYGMVLFYLLCTALLLRGIQPGGQSRVVADAPASEPQAPYSVTVLPGDADVERGERVVVLARFDGPIPPSATLHLDDGREIPLKKNLKDPVFGGFIESVDQDMSYHVGYDGNRSDAYRITVFEYPELRRADASIQPPAYTGLPEEHLEDTRFLSVMEQSTVDFLFHLNKPVTKARLVDKQDNVTDLAPDPEHAHRYRAQVIPDKNRIYTVELVDDAQRKNRDRARIRIEVTRNHPPKIKFTFPRRDVSVSPVQELSVTGEISDDLGIEAHGLTLMFNSERQEMPFESAGSARKQQKFQHLIDFESLQAEPNQVLNYYVWAQDIGPDGQTRRVESDMYFAEVRHFEQILREQLAQSGESEPQGNQQADELIKLQKDIIIATWKLQRKSGGRDELAALTNDTLTVRDSQAQAMLQALDAQEQAASPQATRFLAKAVTHMTNAWAHLDTAVLENQPGPFPSALSEETSAYQALVQLKGQERNVTMGQPGKSSSSASASEREALEELALKQEARRYETERQAEKEKEAQSSQQREMLQALSRLKDLARRQDELKDRLKELQAALEVAKSEEERQRLLRELKRLEEEQRELLEMADELRQRMDREENREQMADARQQLDRTRDRVRAAADQMEQQDLSSAMSSTTRAQRDFQEMQEEFRKKTARKFSDEMREMRKDARELVKRQESIKEQIERETDSEFKRLTPSETSRTTSGELTEQQDRLNELMDDVTDVSRKAEVPEPLLSRRLHNVLRESNHQDMEKALEDSASLLEFSRPDLAKEANEQATRGMRRMKEGIEKAAETILGDEGNALRMARAELDQLIDQLEEEVDRSRSPEASRQEPASRQPADDAPGQRPSPQQDQAERQGPEEGKEGEPRQSRDSGQSSPQQQQANQAQPGEPGQSESESNREGGRNPQQSETETGSRENRSPSESGGQQEGPSDQARDSRQNASPTPPNVEQGTRREGRDGGWSDGRRPGHRWEDWTLGPLTGTEYKEWSDRLRDVEEMLEDEDLRNRMALVRDRARAERVEFKRHSKSPEWDLVEQQILEPLTELRNQIAHEIALKESQKALVPIDRDPIPSRFEDLVRRYYEKLGAGD